MTWEEKLKASREWVTLPKAKRKAQLKQARLQDRILQSEEKPIPPQENPFVIPPGMTPEEATREKIRLDAEEFPVTTRSHEEEIERRRMQSSRSSLPLRPRFFTGPRGGRYRINSKGCKSYDVL